MEPSNPKQAQAVGAPKEWNWLSLFVALIGIASATWYAWPRSLQNYGRIEPSSEQVIDLAQSEDGTEAQ